MIKKIHNYFNEFKSGTKIMFKEFFNKETNKKQRANMWTFSRLVISFLIVISSVLGVLLVNPALLCISSALTIFGALTDYFDGRSAKKHKSCSEYGKLLDQVTDKVFTVLVASSLLLINRIYITILLGEGLIALVNIEYTNKYKDLKVSSTQIGRVKQWPLSASLALGFLSPINNILLTISNSSIIITAIMQLLTVGSYIKQNNAEIKIINKNKSNLSLEAYENDDKIKSESLELTKNNDSIEINEEQNLSKKEQYYALRNALNEIIIKSENNDEIQLVKQMQLKK